MSDFASKMDQAARLWSQGQFQQAAEVFRQANELDPKNPIARANYAIALAKAGDPAQALPVLEKTAADFPQIPDLLLNLGNVYRLLLRLPEAANAYQRATTAKPDYAEAHVARSLTLLLNGDFAEGWKQFDWRFRLPGKKPMPFVGPPWNGSLEALRGRQLMLGAEQGFGDTIMFARYVPILADAGAHVTLVCQPELKQLLKTVPKIGHVMTPGDPIPRYEIHAPLMSVGKLLGTNLQSIPTSTPYLSADPQKQSKWRERLAALGPTKKVGIAWAGRPTHTNDRNRSMQLQRLASLLGVPNVTFVSVQKGPATDQLRSYSQIIDAGNDLNDFADTAALLSELDLLISVDTSVVHLAGALNKPVWVLLPHLPDWRWLLGRTETAWYPAMKLFRQDGPGTWSRVIERVVAEVQAFVSD
jgi:hypothetical protein